jgi:hypothetical protein
MLIHVSNLLLSATIQNNLEARSAIVSSAVVVALQAQNGVEALFPVAHAVSMHWPSAEAVKNISCELSTELKEQTKALFPRMESVNTDYVPPNGGGLSSQHESLNESATWDTETMDRWLKVTYLEWTMPMPLATLSL